ncbi:MAG: Flagellar basal-body rod protein FlgF, partial [uncultured Acetobacteraceae bacterium]
GLAWLHRAVAPRRAAPQHAGVGEQPRQRGHAGLPRRARRVRGVPPTAVRRCAGRRSRRRLRHRSRDLARHGERVDLHNRQSIRPRAQGRRLLRGRNAAGRTVHPRRAVHVGRRRQADGRGGQRRVGRARHAHRARPQRHPRRGARRRQRPQRERPDRPAPRGALRRPAEAAGGGRAALRQRRAGGAGGAARRGPGRRGRQQRPARGGDHHPHRADARVPVRHAVRRARGRAPLLRGGTHPAPPL